MDNHEQNTGAKAETAVLSDAVPRLKADTQPANASLLEWVRVVGPLVCSWPLVVLLVVWIFQRPLLKVFDRFAETEGSTAELGPIKIALGKAAVIPPEYRSTTKNADEERIDLATEIGEIRDTGPEGTTVGFALAYALQAEIHVRRGRRVVVSPRGIYVVARRYDEFPGEDYDGTSVLGGLKGLRDFGAYLESDWPYSRKTPPGPQVKPAYRVSGYRQVVGVEAIISALREKHVVVASVNVTDDFDKPSADGVVTIKLPLKELGGKAITIVGYDSRAASFTFANDWGLKWGREGFGVIRDTDLARVIVSAYSIEL